MAITIDARIRQKVGTEAQWLLNTLPLLDGECAVVRRADGMPVNLKFGDGGKTFAQLPYFIQYDQAAYIVYTATPTQPVAYTIVGEGTYGSIVIGEGRLAVLGWDGSTWSKNVDIDIPKVDINDALNQWILSESFTIQSYTEDLQGIQTAQITFPDGQLGSITTVTYDSQSRVTSMVYNYNSTINKTLTITYNNNQIQTSIA